MGGAFVGQAHRWLGQVALGCLAACGSAGSGAPVEPRPVVMTPSPQLERDVDASAATVAADAARDIASANAPPTSSAEPSKSTSGPPAPPLAGCDGRVPDPRCFAAFPPKVDCPRKFAEVPKGANCGLDGTTQPARCVYPEGLCKCEHVPYCGGAAPTYLQMMAMQWSCGPPPGPDDCPSKASQGTTCRKNGQVCGYGGCGTSTKCTCTNGRFNCTVEHWAPPP